MRAVLERKQLPGVRVLDGTATKMPVESGWADAVVVAQVCFFCGYEDRMGVNGAGVPLVCEWGGVEGDTAVLEERWSTRVGVESGGL